MYSNILVALDGSEFSKIGGSIGMLAAGKLGSRLYAAHIFDAKIHTSRFSEMEPVLPDDYHNEENLDDLRKSHSSLIKEGFHSLSKGYMEDFVKEADKSCIKVIQVHEEGRNYKHLLNIIKYHNIDLAILGYSGLGGADTGRIGSTALRVLRKAECDVLIAKDNRILSSGNDFPVIAGIDGSNDALESMRKASNWARIFGKSLILAACYDPLFHTNIFRTMGHSLSTERQEEIGLQKQEKLHDDIIDTGLGKLYETYLKDAEKKIGSPGINIQTKLIPGKAYRTIHELAGKTGACLVSVGRFGHNKDDIIDIGSNSEALAHMAGTNILITHNPADHVKTSNTGAERSEMEWDQDALSRLNRIPAFARQTAKSMIEDYARERGDSKVTSEYFNELASKLGMSKG